MPSVLLIPQDGSETVSIDTWQSWDTAVGDTATEYPVENEEAAADAIIKGARSIQLSCVFSRDEVRDGIIHKLNALRGKVLNLSGPDGLIWNVVILSMSHSVNSGAFFTRVVSLAMRTIGIGTPTVLQKAAPPPGQGKAKPKDKGQATAAAKPTNRSVLKKLADGAARAVKALGGGG